jgi:DNA-binding GntR family transcriptional regulator
LGARRSASTDVAERKALTKELRALNQEFARAARGAPVDHSKLYDVDERLHRRIVQAGVGPRLLALHDAVKPQAERYIRMYISMLTGDIKSSVDEHDAIIDAIEEGRANDAQQAVEVNWAHAAERLAKVIEVAGERGSW